MLCANVVSTITSRYVVAWCEEIARVLTTETLRSLRSSMLSWGSGRGRKPTASAPRSPVPFLAPVTPPVADDDTLDVTFLADDSGDQEESALLAGAAANATSKRRLAIRIKRKSKIAIRVARCVMNLCYYQQINDFGSWLEILNVLLLLEI